MRLKYNFVDVVRPQGHVQWGAYALDPERGVPVDNGAIKMRCKDGVVALYVLIVDVQVKRLYSHGQRNWKIQSSFEREQNRIRPRLENCRIHEQKRPPIKDILRDSRNDEEETVKSQ